MKHERRGSEITERIVATARRIPITGWFVGSIVLGVSTITLLMFSTSSVVDPEYKDLDTVVVTESHTKNLIVGVNKTEETTGEESVPAGSGSVVDIQLGKGKLITNTTKNPLSLPIYDGYTHEGEYFDVDFSRFWNSGDVMSGLGDYESKEKNHIISYEGAGNSKVPIENAINQYRTSEGRLVVALGPGVIVDPAIYEPEIDSFWANPDKYTFSTAGKKNDWCKGTTAIVYKSKIWDNQQIGMYIDCVLQDGTVIAMILGDEKALHKGLYNNSEYCFDYETKGYAHVRQDKNSGSRSYSIIELCGSGNGKKTEMNLAGNKIVKFRCYTDTKNRFN